MIGIQIGNPQEIMFNHIAQFEPLLIGETRPQYRRLIGMAEALAESSARLDATIPARTAEGLRSLVAGMNCYYSNLIEGHHTHPIDIDRAMHHDYAENPKQRDLQYLAVAHIETGRWSLSMDLCDEIAITPFIIETHRRFCSNLPPSMLTMEGEGQMVPGELRHCDVAVGQHIAPQHDSIPRFLDRYEAVYGRALVAARRGGMEKLEAIVASMTAHHRLAWIHPFPDGNGRVARIVLDAMLKKSGLSSVGLWSMSRGLAKADSAYKQKLASADETRMGDLDGRGNLSEQRLGEFCEFSLAVAKDQINFMSKMLSVEKVEQRCHHYFSVMQNEIRPEAAHLYARAFQKGEFERGEAERLTGLGERTARDTLRKMIQAGFLVSDSPKGKVRVGFPMVAMGSLFPNLYPAGDMDAAHRNEDEYEPSHGQAI